MDRQVKPTTRSLHMHTPERRVKGAGGAALDALEDHDHTITPTNSSNNLQALRQPGFFSSDTEVDDLHDFHDTHNSTPDHGASPKAQFYFPGPLPHEPVNETVRILSYAPPHPEARGRSKGDDRLEEVERRGERKDRNTNQIDGGETPHLERAVGGGAVAVNSDKEPGRDYSRRFYVPEVPLSIPAATRPKSPEKSPPPVDKGNMATKKLHFHTAHSSATSSSIAPAEEVGTPVILSKAPPHPFTKRIDSNASMSSEVDMAPTTGSTSSSRATVEAKFQVRVTRVSDGEEVRVSGNDTVLGAWDVTKSVPMKRSTEHPDLWYVNVELPVLQDIKYRYLVVEKVQSNSSSGETINIIRWETMLHPRYCRFSLPGSHEAVDGEDREHEEKCHDYRENGVFGENERGETSADDGWLVGVSELHLRLLPPGAENDPPIQIASLPSNYSQYSVKLKPFTYGSKQKDVACSDIKVKRMDRQRGDCDFFSQNDKGCYFNQETRGLTFWTQAQNFDKIGFTVDIYAHEEEQEDENGDGKEPTAAATTTGGSSSSSAEVSLSSLVHVGRTSILPQQYLIPDKSQGMIVLTVFSPELLSIGTMTFSYLLIHPVKESPAVHTCKYSFATHWKKHKRALDIGHRGLGDSYHLHGELKPSVTENTLASLRQAGAHGADYVEFDVQLTKDYQLVVYHDFRVVTTLAKQGFFSGELYEMLVKDLTLSQLQSLKLEHSSVLSQHNRHLNLPEGVRSASQSSGGETSHDSDSSLETYWGTGYKEDLPERKTFPLLKLLFKKIPRNIGFNIEIKYPNPCKNMPTTHVEYFDRNVMADYVLKTVYRCSNRRKIIFSCFDADMCTVLRRKQPKYPVLFLTTNLLPEYGVPFDVRTQSIYDAMMHARTEKLLGVNMNSTQLLAQPELVKEMERRRLVLFTWGHDNNNVTNIQLQRDWGVAAVIYDCINMLIPPQKTIFQLEEEEEKAMEIQRWQERRQRASIEQQKRVK